MATVQPLRPYAQFTDETGRLTTEGYDFLYNIFLRVGGSLSSLNAVTLLTYDWNSPGTIGATAPSTGKFTTVQSTITTGTAPFIVASTTNVANLNASSLNGATFASPGAIGGTTPSAATFTTINGNTFTAGTGTLTIAAGKTATINKTLTLTGTDSTTMTFPTTSATIARTDAANTFTGHQTIEGVTSTGATGTNKFVFDTTPTLVTPILGVATGTSITLTGGFGCNGAAIQTAYPSGGALAAYGAGANGFDTAGHASALYAEVVAIRAALVANGIMS